MKTTLILPLLLSGLAIAQLPGTFAQTGSLSAIRQFHTATLLTNGKVLIAGGFFIPGYAGSYSVRASTELYDPSTGIFAVASSMTTGRYFHTATLLPDGKVLITGGNNSVYGGCFCAPLASAEVYDPSTGTFTASANMTAPRSTHTATLLNNGKVLITGGYVNGRSAGAELYDPSTGTFSATGSEMLCAPMRSARNTTP